LKPNTWKPDALGVHPVALFSEGDHDTASDSRVANESQPTDEVPGRNEKETGAAHHEDGAHYSDESRNPSR
jgi:hypothetical protein